jgi:hypothetical protein
MPLSLNNEPEMSLMQLSQVIDTAKRVFISQCEVTRDTTDGEKYGELTWKGVVMTMVMILERKCPWWGSVEWLP